MSPTDFTIAICTYNRPRLLEIALQSIVDAGDAAKGVPLVVVDNGLFPETRRVAERLGALLEGLRYVEEPTTGLSHARNRALAETSTPYIVYVDDDVKLDPAWFAALREGLVAWHLPKAFGGPYRPFYLEQKPSWYLDRYGSEHVDKPEGPLRPGQHVTGCNMGWCVDLLRRLGGFPTDLGMIGTRLGLGEETYLLNLLHAEFPQEPVIFLPRMALLHYVQPERMSLRYLWRRAWVYGWNLRVVEPKTNLLTFRQVKQELLLFPRLAWRFVRRDRVRYPHWRNYAVEGLIRSAIFWGTALERQRHRFRRAKDVRPDRA